MSQPLIDQYVLVVNGQRGFNQFQLFKSVGNSVDVSDSSQWQFEAQSRISDGLVKQEILPYNGETFTISATEP